MDKLPHPGVGLIPDGDWPRIARDLRLTPREAEVVRLLFEGLTRRQVAGRMRCSLSNVRQHIDRLFEKLQVEERVGLVLRVVRAWLQRPVRESADSGPSAV